ncbi:hypothetical protein [uncultured Psychroserpens sp.]|uniref:hypothetical protein n=1 Tax=uncultured Psychroserpens sp. TaxID=255436 RepID=UPI00260ABCB9|nr:hypothetical protein [uncultured Psychroserpens sp.]
MSEKKNIDKLFKEQLKDFEVAPNDAVWENIERELHKDKRKRRVIPIWWKIAGVAAALLLLFTVGQKLFSPNDSAIEQEVVDTNKSSNDTSNDTNDTGNTKSSDLNTSKDLDDTPIVDNHNSKNDDHSSITDNSNNDLTNSEDSNNKTTVVSSKEKKKTSSFKDKSLIKNKSLKEHAVANKNNNQLPQKNKTKTATTVNTNKEAVANTSNDSKLNKDNDLNPVNKEKSEIDKLINDIKKSKETQVTSSTPDKENAALAIDTSKSKDAIKKENDIETAIAEAEKNKDETEEPEELLKRWSVAPNVAPVYFNTLGKGSPIDDQFINNTKEGDVNVSYGVKGSYAINKKLKIRAGINKVDLGYTTNNVVAFTRPTSSGNNTRQLQNIKLHDSTTTFISANSISYTTGPEILFTKEQGSIDQQLGFIEVPIEVEYSLIDKKIGLNLIGGFSTLFLSNNEIYSVQNNGDRAFLGEATNINDMSYSANFGIGVNYNISKQLRFNLEPTFKYQINTFNDTSGDFQPFFIGVYTGLSFKF